MIRFLAWLAVAAALTFVGTLALYAAADAMIGAQSKRAQSIELQTEG